MASGMASFTLGDLHSITTTGSPFRNSTMSGMMWCSVPGTRTLNWQTAVKRLLPRSMKSMKRTVGLLSPVCRFRLTLVFSDSRLNTWRLFSNSPVPGKLAVSRLTTSSTLAILQPGIDDLELLAQHGQHHHFGEVLTMAVGRELLLVEVEDLPAEPGELVQERFLDVVPLVQADAIGVSWWSRLCLAQSSTPEARCNARTGPA